MGERLFEFVWLPTFERAAKRLLSDHDRQAIEARLCELVYAKGKKETLTREEENELRRVAAALLSEKD